VTIRIPVGVDASGAVASIQAVTDSFNRLRHAAEAASKAGAAGGQSDALKQQLADIQRVEAALANTLMRRTPGGRAGVERRGGAASGIKSRQ